ncbi:MAG: hypothetical protein KME32_26855 [Mojavia pulchra JT2-VF2]|jgi:hypothetical protein|uniref:Uncharacterized protein n=1 Tax=Mojavia pulchra JT2-VF2 TaxID=287848 RepID=A0A951UII3_9NOST|nr:hypothetical protein [Mojavia pulchra JT2-VF2]
MTNTISSRNRLSPQPHKPPDLISAQRLSDEIKGHNHTSTTVSHQVQLPLNELRIVHATTGRVRIRTNENSSSESLKAISQYLRQQNGVKEVVANQQTGSLVINFDQNQLSLPQVLEILAQFGIRQISADSDSASNTDIFADWKSLDFWKEQTISFIPLMTGLAVTGGLGISGLPSIPVYMITANATRWVIDRFEPQGTASETSKDSQTDSATKSPEGHLTNGDRKSVIKSNTSPETELSAVVDNSDSATSLGKIVYSVVHAIPGRIRFHVPQLAHDRAYARRLERLLKTDPQVTNVRLNYQAASIAIAYGTARSAIAYQPVEISISHWVSLMELALQTNPPTNPIQTIEQQTPPEEVSQPTEPIAATIPEGKTSENNSLWAAMKPPALSFSLAFMANFPLQTVFE